MISTWKKLWNSYFEKEKVKNDINVKKDLEFVKQYETSDDQNITEGQGCKYEEDDEEERYFDAIEFYFEIRSKKGQVVGQKSEEGERQKSFAALIPQYEELLIQQEFRWHTCFLIQPDDKSVTHDAGNGYTRANNKAIIVEKRGIHFSFKYLCYRAYGSSVLRFFPIFISCAEGTGQSKHQVHSEIYESTLRYVSNCPSPGEYIQRSLEKCADVCGSYMQYGKCAYHCMRDSSKTKLAEFCAEPKILFGYCPEYDPVDQTIQKDLATLCNSTLSRNYYNSSDIYFCDPDNCLQIHGSSDRSGATTLTTLMTEYTDINSGDIQQMWSLQNLLLILLLIMVVIVVAFATVCILRKSKVFSARHRNEKSPKNMEKGMKKALLWRNCEI